MLAWKNLDSMADENENSTRLVGQLLYSERFDDFYSARLTPDQEKSYVFCTGNDLEARFPTAQNFTIVELGFGAGLGFLAAAHLWRETATADARLNFISIEKYPLERDKLRSFLRQFPQWEKLSETLLAHWPVATPGFHRIDLPDTGITLTLIFSEVLGALQQLEANVDAWFLDGFSPAKNPAMWR
ncbi:MAG TPA: hypothetical protein ENJ35_10835, partial [Gammaproteobacteria bacterium]|nr:hypothetical protein [Gammaproteobacteria bacterium]